MSRAPGEEHSGEGYLTVLWLERWRVVENVSPGVFFSTV
jgi:hypothetical protein